MLPALLRHRVISVHSRRLSPLVECFRHVLSQLVGMDECLARFVEFTQLQPSFTETIDDKDVITSLKLGDGKAAATPATPAKKKKKT